MNLPDANELKKKPIITGGQLVFYVSMLFGIASCVTLVRVYFGYSSSFNMVELTLAIPLFFISGYANKTIFIPDDLNRCEAEVYVEKKISRRITAINIIDKFDYFIYFATILIIAFVWLYP